MTTSTGMNLELRDLVLSYGGAPVVDGLNLDVAPGAAGGFSLEALEDVHFTAGSGTE